LRLFNQGFVLVENGERMSKSRGNVVGIDETIERFGADALRLFEMFAGPPEADFPWSTTSIAGVTRTLNRIWRLVVSRADDVKAPVPSNGRLATQRESDLRYSVHSKIKQITEELGERMHLNTCVAAIMMLLNDLEDFIASVQETSPSPAFVEGVNALLLLLAPFAPHITEELWERTGHAGSVHEQAWPTYDEGALARAVVPVVVQVNGKWRAVVDVPPGAGEDAAFALATTVPTVQAQLNGKTVRKKIYVTDKLLNIVVG
jgi:leucyl-tRNA synthetase